MIEPLGLYHPPVGWRWSYASTDLPHTGGPVATCEGSHLPVCLSVVN